MKAKNIYLARRRREIFAIIGIILSIFIKYLMYFCSCLSIVLLQSNTNHHEKKIWWKNIKKLYSSEPSKNSIFGGDFFSGYPPRGVGGWLAKSPQISENHGKKSTDKEFSFFCKGFNTDKLWNRPLCIVNSPTFRLNQSHRPQNFRLRRLVIYIQM